MISTKKWTNYAMVLIGFLCFCQQMNAQNAVASCNGNAGEYVIQVTGLQTGDVLTIGSTATTFSGTTHTTSPIAFVDGKTKTLVEVNRGGVISTFNVNEVLCEDIEGDGVLDFNTNACDYTKPIGSNGVIISTVAPFSGDNVYVYFLTDAAGNYTGTSSYSGHFEDLVDGSYQVFAYNFTTEAEAASYISGLTAGTDMNTETGSSTTCFAFCGIAPSASTSYVIDCGSIVVVTDPLDQYVCHEGDATFTAPVDYVSGATVPTGSTLTYQWQKQESGTTIWSDVASATGTVTPTAVPDTATIDLTNLDFAADNGDMYRVIVTMTVGGTTISMDTSAAANLEVYEDPILASTLSTTINSNDSTNIVLSTTGTIAATSYEIISITASEIAANGFTADAGNATTGITTDSMVIQGDIFVNNTGIDQTVSYVIVPISADGCRGDEVTVVVTVTSCPVVSDVVVSDPICSDETGLTLGVPANDDNGLAIQNYEIISINTGTATADASNNTVGFTTTTSTDLDGDVFTNITDAQVDVVYTIRATTNSCSVDFTVTVSVDPEPVFASDIIASTCSDTPINVTLPTTDDSGLTVSMIDVSASEVPGLTGTPTTGTSLTSFASAIAADQFTNTTGGDLIVTYTITPYAGADNCPGEPYDVIVTITNEPVGIASNSAVCSDEAISIDLTSVFSNLGTTPTFSWTASYDAGLSGNVTGTQTSATIADNITNQTVGDLTVTYTITPTNDGGCVGDPFDVVVTVHPEPVYTQVDLTVCSGDTLDVNALANHTATSTTAATYTYTVTSNSGSVTAGADRTTASSANITDTYTNTTNADVTITYEVTPYSTVDNCPGDPFDVVVTVQPEPVMASTLDATVCSDAPIGLTLAVDGSSVAADQYQVVSITPDAGLTAAGTNAAAATVTAANADTYANDSYTNVTTGPLTVTYTVIPTTGTCAGEELAIVITIDPAAVVEAGSASPLCSSADLDLTALGASITGGASGGTWSSEGAGTFTGGTAFGSATAYTPSTAELDAGEITLYLTSTDPTGECPTVFDEITVSILDIRCSTFPWDGN